MVLLLLLLMRWWWLMVWVVVLTLIVIVMLVLRNVKRHGSAPVFGHHQKLPRGRRPRRTRRRRP